MAEPEETAMPAIAAGPALPPPVFRVSHLSYPELSNLILQLRTQAEAEWQRVVNVHAALIGVMIFFANQPDSYSAARIVVFVFYTFNLIVSHFNLGESFEGLRQANRDLMLFPAPAAGGHSIGWLKRRSYQHDARLRAVLMIVVWAVILYLMIVPLIFGRDHLAQ